MWGLRRTRGAGILGGAPNVTAHSLTGRRRRRSVCRTRNPHDTVSSLSTTPSRDTHACYLRTVDPVRDNYPCISTLRREFLPVSHDRLRESQCLPGRAVFTQRYTRREITRDISLAGARHCFGAVSPNVLHVCVRVPKYTFGKICHVSQPRPIVSSCAFVISLAAGCTVGDSENQLIARAFRSATLPDSLVHFSSLSLLFFYYNFKDLFATVCVFSLLGLAMWY